MAEQTQNDIVARIREAGVVGAGGAGFPTHVKARARAEVVIANGAECEPLLGCDKALLVSNPKGILEGLKIMGRATGARELVLAVKEKNREGVRALETALGKTKKIRIHLLGDFYPSGDEVTLVYEVTGRLVPEGGIPPDVGVVVQNVATLAQVADAMQGRAVTRRLFTVAGAVDDPATFEVPIGTPLRDLVAAAGGTSVDPFSLVVGGACMGWMAASLDDPVEKTHTGALVLPPDHPLVALKSANIDQLLHRARSVCDQCRDCTDLCPRYLLGHRLEPHRLMTAIGWGNELGTTETRTAHLCCECGICGIYACPMGLYPNLYIHRIKEELNAHHLPRERGRTPAEPHEDYGGRKLPLARLKARLGLTGYTEHTPLKKGAISPKEVKLLLKQHIGAPSVPVVQKDQVLREGDVVAEIPKEALGARIHASLSGRVKAVTDAWVILQGDRP
jgi:Na+-translocating ferredoxin:NAD+ oxidoreductase RnfC subunit